MIRDAHAARRRLTATQQRLVEQNVGLAYCYARRFSTPRYSTEDLLGAACEALCRSTLTWRAESGSFARYASAAICNAVKAELRYLSRSVHVPRTMSQHVAICHYRYDPTAIPSRQELLIVLEKKRLGDREYQYFRNAWFMLRGTEQSFREVW